MMTGDDTTTTTGPQLPPDISRQDATAILLAASGFPVSIIAPITHKSRDQAQAVLDANADTVQAFMSECSMHTLSELARGALMARVVMESDRASVSDRQAEAMSRTILNLTKAHVAQIRAEGVIQPNGRMIQNCNNRVEKNKNVLSAQPGNSSRARDGLVPTPDVSSALASLASDPGE